MKSQSLITLATGAALFFASSSASGKNPNTRNKEADVAATVEQLRKESLELRRQLETMQRSLNRLAKSLNQKGIDQTLPLSKNRDGALPTNSPAAPAFTIPLQPSAELSFQRKLADPAGSWQAYLKGVRLEEQRLCHEAIAAYSSALELDPRNDSALLHRGYCYSQLGDNNRAAADLSLSLDLQPNNSRAYMARATAYAALGKAEFAMADINEVLLRDPENNDGLSLRARLYEVAGAYDKAVAEYSVLLTVNPDSETGHLSRAIALRKQGLASQALPDCDNAVRVNPLSPAGYLCRAESYLGAGSSTNALDQLNQAIAAAQALHQPLEALSGLVQTISSETAVAAKLPGAAAEVMPMDSKPVAVAPVQPTPAQDIPVQIASNDNLSPSAQFAPPSTIAARPVALMSGERPVSTSNQAQRQDDAVFYLRLARFRAKSSAFQEAVKAYTMAVEFDPTSAAAYNGRGYAYLRLRKFDQAVADFSAAIRLNPNYVNAFQNRAAVLRLMGNAQQAREDLRKASELSAQSTVQPATQRPSAPLRLSSAARSTNP